MTLNLETTVQKGLVMQEFKLDSYVNLPPSTAISRLKQIAWVLSAASLVLAPIEGEEGSSEKQAPKPMDYTLYAAPLLPLDNPLPIQTDGKMRRTLNTATTQLIEKQAAAIDSRLFPWRFLLATILAALTFTVIWWRKKPIAQVVPTKPQSLLYLDKARDLLGQLQSEQPPELVKEYFTLLTEAVRYHIEETYNINATTQTSEEFLRNTALKGEDSKQLKKFLDVCDAVKFGQYQPSHLWTINNDGGWTLKDHH